MKTSPATTMFVFAFYLAGLAAIFLIIPNVLLSLFGLPETNEVWIRALGMVVLFLAVYYFQMARENNLTLIRTTIYTRATVPLFVIAFVALGFSSINLMLFAFPDLLGALWTWYAVNNASKDF